MDFLWKGKAIKETKFWKTVYTDSRHMSANDFHWETMVCVLHGFSLGESENPLYEKLMDFSALQGPLDYVDFAQRMKNSSHVPEMLQEIRERLEQDQWYSENDKERIRFSLSKLMQKREEKITTVGLLALMGTRRNIFFDFWEKHKDLQKFMFELWTPFILASETEKSYDLEKGLFPWVINPYVESEHHNRSENPYEVRVDDVLNVFKKSTQLYPSVNVLKNIRSVINSWISYNEHTVGRIKAETAEQVVEVLVGGLENIKKAGHEIHGSRFGDRILSAWLRRAVIFSEQKKNENFFLFRKNDQEKSILQRLNTIYEGDPINAEPFGWLPALLIRRDVTDFADQLTGYVDSQRKRRSGLLRLELGELLNRYQELGVHVTFLNPESSGDKYKLERLHQILDNENPYYFDYVGHEKNLERFYPKIREEEWVEGNYSVDFKNDIKTNAFEKFFIDKNLLRNELGFKETIATFTNLLRRTESVSKPLAEQWGEIALREIQNNPLLRSQIKNALESTSSSLCEKERMHPNTVRPFSDVRLLLLSTLMEMGVSLVSPDPDKDFLSAFLKEDQPARMPALLSRCFAEDPAIGDSAFFKQENALMVLEKTPGSQYLKSVLLEKILKKDVKNIPKDPSVSPVKVGLNRF